MLPSYASTTSGTSLAYLNTYLLENFLELRNNARSNLIPCSIFPSLINMLNTAHLGRMLFSKLYPRTTGYPITSLKSSFSSSTKNRIFFFMFSSEMRSIVGCVLNAMSSSPSDTPRLRYTATFRSHVSLLRLLITRKAWTKRESVIGRPRASRSTRMRAMRSGAILRTPISIMRSFEMASSVRPWRRKACRAGRMFFSRSSPRAYG
uniref:Uncharacterized protein n=1 Tax=Arundo donax TaxID=35708 RepID=A0A0A8ZZ77_ARUDO